MSKKLANRAVVIGGSVAGLAAARVLSDHCEEVVVLERDTIGDAFAVRPSAPQASHAHGLLVAGERVLSRLFPGFTDDLLAGGARVGRVGRDLVSYMANGRSYNGAFFQPEPRDLGVDIYCQSRMLLEGTLRRRLERVPGVEVRTGVGAVGLEISGGRVTGVRLDDGRSEAATLAADLVLDASGRGSRAPRWLRDLGFAAPEETVIGCDFAYASCLFQGDGSLDVVGVVVPGRPPVVKRGALLFCIENGRWLVSIGGRFGEKPPRDLDGFMRFTRELPNPFLHQLLEGRQPLVPVTYFEFPTSRIRHYERIEVPDGLLVAGDALCSFNPIYGQGMSAALLEVDALARLLDRRAGETGSAADAAPSAGLSAEYFAQAAQVIATPWRLAASADFQYPETTGERPENSEERGLYLLALNEIAIEDVEVNRTLAEVFQLVRPMSDLDAEPLRSRGRARMKIIGERIEKARTDHAAAKAAGAGAPGPGSG
jgi:2-polyprenyl-6-methoxyphenol hydroxylase-like FAD-dependent oxidoreductase